MSGYHGWLSGGRCGESKVSRTGRKDVSSQEMYRREVIDKMMAKQAKGGGTMGAGAVGTNERVA